MANRSDFNSIFPRQLKRSWALGTYVSDEHRADVKKLLIKAHKALQEKANKRLTMDTPRSTKVAPAATAAEDTGSDQ